MKELIDEGIVGYSVITDVTCTKDDNGYWTVEQIVTQKRTKDGEEWESASVQMRAIDKNMDRAASMATMSILYYLETIDGDLFKESNNEDIPTKKGGYIQ